MADRPDYKIHTDVQFEPLTRIDIPALVQACQDDWYNQTLTRVNDSVVRLGIIKGEFHFHKHDEQDEFFYVVEGAITLEIEGRDSVALGPGQGLTVPHGVVHRPLAPEGAVILMVEGCGVVPTGD